MSESEEPIYSTMFSSLKHPVRRKILRMLSERTTSFSQMLEELGVSSPNLTYHLESLGELLCKTDGGDYKLSTFGEAAVNTMRIVEDAPVVQSKQKHWFISLRFKSILGILIIGLVLLASFSVIEFNELNQLSKAHSRLQSEYNQLQSFTASTDKAISFLRDVIELDLIKYDATLLSNTVDHPSGLDGFVEQILRYSLVSSESKIEVILRFRNNILSNYQMVLLDGLPIYAEPQPFTVLDSAKWLLYKLLSYENAPYLSEMNNTLYQFGEADSIEMTQGNLKFNESISGANAEMEWFYTENGIDFAQKGLKLIFENQALKELDDGYFLFKIGSAQVNVSSEEAIQIAMNAVKGFTWKGSNGQTVSGYNVLDEPVSAIFQPATREDPLSLVPCWYVTLYLDNVYPTNINRIAVWVWADTGKTGQIKPITG
jgi:DNA-binding transcriptional ArsR family regulator